MSDLSLDSETASPENTPVVKPSSSKDLPPLNLNKANERRSKFGKVSWKKYLISIHLNNENQLCFRIWVSTYPLARLLLQTRKMSHWLQATHLLLQCLLQLQLKIHQFQDKNNFYRQNPARKCCRKFLLVDRVHSNLQGLLESRPSLFSWDRMHRYYTIYLFNCNLFG